MTNALVHALSLAAIVGPACTFPSVSPLTGHPAGVAHYATWQQPAVFNTPLLKDIRSPNEKRQSRDSESDVGQGKVFVQDSNAAEGEHPQAFSILWDAVANEICDLSVGCRDTETCTAASEYSTLCIKARGNFASADKQYFLDATREIFDRTVNYGYVTPDPDSIPIFQGANEDATDIVALRKADGYLQVEFTQTQNSDQCPNYVTLIAGAGALAGPAAPFFGIIGLLCGGIESGILEP